MGTFSKNFRASKRLFAAVLIFLAGFIGTGGTGPAKADNHLPKISDVKSDGICDGSAAIRLDSKTILVAYDEKNVLYAYNIKGGKPLTRIAIAQLMDLPTGDESDEIDIEAAVRGNGKIWWIGSHSQNKKGKDRPNRRMIFSTNVPSRPLNDTQVIDPPFDLTDVFLENPVLEKILPRSVRSSPPKHGGISIEGLTRHPKGGLIVGFRSPLTGANGQSGNAIAVHIAKQNGRFHVKKVYTLDLGNRGFRDIARHQDGFLLIAGAAGKRSRSVLYNWHPATGSIKQISAPFNGLNPEALVRINQHWLVLSDDGKQQRPDKSAADGDRKCDKIHKKPGENQVKITQACTSTLSF